MSHARNPQANIRKSQRGLIGILLLVTIAVVALTVFSKNLWGEDSKAYQAKVNREALKQAKAALLEYIEVGGVNDLSPVTDVLTASNGRLPCPAQNGDGLSDVPCGTNASQNLGIHSLGLLPWATLGLPAIRDASRQCLWYAVDGLYKNSPIAPSLNADSQGSFSVVQPRKVVNATTGVVTWVEDLLAGNTGGVASNNRVVAVIISPGAASGTQTQSESLAGFACPLPTQFGGAPNAEASAISFLKFYVSNTLGIIDNTTVGPLGANIGNPAVVNPVANGSLKSFVTADIGQEQLNDQIIWITAEEFAKAATKRTARLYASAINSYVNANGYYPTAASTPGGTCQAGLLQGYMPYTCAQLAGGPQAESLDFYLGSRLVGAGNLNTVNTGTDPDWWGAQTHYAVSQDCINTGIAATRGTAAVHDAIFTMRIATPANPCRNRAGRINLGAGANGPPAIILMRGRLLPGQANCTRFTLDGVTRGPAPPYVGGAGGTAANAAVNIAGCLENTINQTAVHNAFGAGALTGLAANMGAITYAVPSAANSNDYMVQFTTP